MPRRTSLSIAGKTNRRDASDGVSSVQHPRCRGMGLSSRRDSSPTSSISTQKYPGHTKAAKEHDLEVDLEVCFGIRAITPIGNRGERAARWVATLAVAGLVGRIGLKSNLAGHSECSAPRIFLVARYPRLQLAEARDVRSPSPCCSRLRRGTSQLPSGSPRLPSDLRRGTDSPLRNPGAGVRHRQCGYFSPCRS